jgi:thiol-disulfide isomerase/thioredoxin
MVVFNSRALRRAAGPGAARIGASRHRAAARWVVAIGAALLASAPIVRAAAPAELPPFTHRAAADWINSAPPADGSVRGHPALLEVWTFECSNCLASLPWMQRVAATYRPRGLIVVGVHAPELPEERDPAEVAAAVRRLRIDYPVMLDADFSYWRALGNHYWPAFYLYDATGHLIATRIGELHTGDADAQAFERLIATHATPPGAGR